MAWSLTVAAIIERQGRFLFVEETDGVHPERVFNQPAGHVDPGEGLLEAVIRETREETGLDFVPEALVGIYLVQAGNGRDYARVCFTGRVPETASAAPEDPVILGCAWLTPAEAALRPRSSAVMACLEDYLAGQRLPLACASRFLNDRPARSHDFDALASTWDQDPAKCARAQRVAEAIRAQTGSLTGKRALEYGCGTGLLGFALQPHLAHLTLADSSEGMLSVLRAKIAAAGATNLAPLRLDLNSDPNPAEPFDLVCTLMTLHHIPDTDGILARFRELLNPGGWLCIADLDREDGSFHGPEAAVHRGFDRDDLTRRLTQAGFQAIRFDDPFVIERTPAEGGGRYPAFLVVAERA